jgi:hypothetical protein
MMVQIDRLGKRLLRCGVCRRRCREVHDFRRQREWRDLSMRKLPLILRYRPRRVECARCGSFSRRAQTSAHISGDIRNLMPRICHDKSVTPESRICPVKFVPSFTIKPTHRRAQSVPVGSLEEDRFRHGSKNRPRAPWR